MLTWRRDDLEVEIKAKGSPVSATDKLIERLLRELLATLTNGHINPPQR